jgi:hypothetical protein
MRKKVTLVLEIEYNDETMLPYGTIIAPPEDWNFSEILSKSTNSRIIAECLSSTEGDGCGDCTCCGV